VLPNTASRGGGISFVGIGNSSTHSVNVAISGSAELSEIGDMDRDEAIKLLKGGPEGIDDWNRGRRAVETIPDLSNADLSKARHLGAHLTALVAELPKQAALLKASVTPDVW